MAGDYRGAGTVILYGGSDDLIEVEGDVYEEFAIYEDSTAGPHTVTVVTAGGGHFSFSVTYGEDCTHAACDGAGCWQFKPIAEYGPDVVTILPPRGEDAGDDDDGCPGYSEKVIVNHGSVTHVDLECCSHDRAERRGSAPEVAAS